MSEINFDATMQERTTTFTAEFADFVSLYRGVIRVWIGDGTTGSDGVLYAEMVDGVIQTLGPVTGYYYALQEGFQGSFADWVQTILDGTVNAMNAAQSASEALASERAAASSEAAAYLSKQNAEGSAAKAQQWATGSTGGSYSTGKSAKEQADRAAVWATGSSAGDGSDTNNAKYYSEQANSSSTEALGARNDAVNAKDAAEAAQTIAETEADKSEAWAVGKIDGADVPSSNPAYHNNSKYYAETAMNRAEGIRDNIVLVQDEQPTAEHNKIWVKPNENETTVPSYEEFTSLETVVSAKVNSPAQEGSAGQILMTNGDGTTQWTTPVSPEYEDVKTAIDDWLEDNITNPSSPPLDRSLVSGESAAPADIVGSMKVVTDAADIDIYGEHYLKPEEKTTSDFTSSRFYIMPSTGIAYDFANGTSYIGLIGNCQKISITANSSYNANIAFLTSDQFVNGEAAPLVPDSHETIIAGETMEFSIPDTAVYVYIRYLDSSGHHIFPEDVEFYNPARRGGIKKDAYVVSTKTGEGTIIANGATSDKAISLKFDITTKQEGRGDPSFDNIRPINGTSSLDYSITNEYSSITKTITFGEGVELFGAVVDIVTGDIYINTVEFTFTGDEIFNDDPSWVTVQLEYRTTTPAEGVCSHALFKAYNRGCIGVMQNENICIFDGQLKSASEWKEFCTDQYENGTPVQVMYKIRNPFVIHIDPSDVEFITGTNTITTSTNRKITLKYYQTVNEAFKDLNGDSDDEEQSSTIDDVPTANSNNLVKSGGVYNAIAHVAGMLEFDSTPTVNSSNPVTSNGIASALSQKQDALTFDNTPTADSDNPVKSSGIKSAIDTVTASINSIISDVQGKIAKPTISPNGTSGQLLSTNGDGTTTWVSVGLPTDAQTATAVSAWLTDHPDATTTVQDNSLTMEKFVNGALGYYTPDMFGAEADGTTDDSTAIAAAITAAGTYGTIVIPQGKVYNVGSTGFTLLEGQTITGGGTLLQSTNDNIAILYTDDHVTVDNIRIVQENYHTGYGIKVAGDFVTVKNCYIIDKFVGITGDNIFGNYLTISHNFINTTRHGIYVSRPSSDTRRIGLKIVDNLVVIADGFDTSISEAQIKGINLGCTSGALVRGNIVLGWGMPYCGYRWQDHTIIDANIWDNYVSVIGDYNLVNNNIVDGDLTPTIHFPITSLGMMCAIEIVGDGSTISNNIIRNNVGPAISANDPRRHGLVITGNYIEKCATYESNSTAVLNINGQSDLIISNNVIYDSNNSATGYGAISVAGYKYYPVTNVVISNNTIDGVRENNTHGAIYIRYAKQININNNTIKTEGICLSIGENSQFAQDITISGNRFEGSYILSSLAATNEIRMFNNDCRNAVVFSDNTEVQTMTKNWSNEGLVAKAPQRGTWEIGEIYPTIDGLKRCTVAGTYGITDFPYVYEKVAKADTTEDSNIIHVNDMAAIVLCVGQYITIQDILDKAKVESIQLEYDQSNNISGAYVSLSEAVPETASDITILYCNPSFVTLK